MNLGERIHPSNIDVERTVLGSMMSDPDSFAVAMEQVNAESFYVTAHRTIFDAMSNMWLFDEPCDVVLLSEALRRDGKLEQIGGNAYLSELSSSIATAANISNYIKILNDSKTKRQIITITAEIQAAGFSPDTSADDLLEMSERKIYGLTSDYETEKGLVSYKDQMPITIQRLEATATSQLLGLSTGIRTLDDILSGLCPSDLIIIAGRPSSGKTSLALGIATYLAFQEKNIAFFSCEMSRNQLVLRTIASEAEISYKRLQQGSTLNKEELGRMAAAVEKLTLANLLIDDTPAVTLSKMRSRCRRMKATTGLDLVLVDYLQIMGRETEEENENVGLGKVSAGLKGLAKTFDVPIIALSQLSRRMMDRGGDPRPTLSDLRGSGSIEQDSDVVVFTHRPEMFNKEDETLRGKAELIVEKQRNGPTDTANVRFVSSFAKFVDDQENGQEEKQPKGWSDTQGERSDLRND